MKTKPSVAASRLSFILLTLIFTFFAIRTPAAEIPALLLGAGTGVNIHFTRGNERDLDLIAAAGFKFIRMDFFWSETERTKGVYDWSAYDELTANLEKRGIAAYYIFDYSNPLYESMVSDGNNNQVLASPAHPDSVAAFARWAAAAATHFKGHHIIWEIWNEPNGSFWQPKPDVNAYNTLALATASAVRMADLHATIVAPASSGFPWDYLESFLSSGILTNLDAVSVHPYRDPHQPPETAAFDYARLRQIIAKYQSSDRSVPIPILSGEWGYNTATHNVSLETQAAFAARQQIANTLSEIPISIWYDWKNDGDDPNNGEHNFGTVQPDLTPKLSYTAIKTFTHELDGYAIKNRLHIGSLDDYVLVCTNATGQTMLTAWAVKGPRTINLPLPVQSGSPLILTDGSGQSTNLPISNNQINLPLQLAPIYIPLGYYQNPR